MPDKPARPLYSALAKYAALEPARFHMPGHKGRLFEYDVTEVEGTDNLSAPTGPILELEDMCAESFGSRDALITVNGSTAANIAMLLCLCSGKKVLLARNCHKSVINGMALGDHKAVLLPVNEYGTVTPEEVDEALSKTPCDAVFVTSPTYRGNVCDIAGIAKAAHSHGALLFVDCAHGAHFAFSTELPPVPREADMWCVSCHKTLNALNQTAVLNLGSSCPFTKEEARRALLTVQTTSPSYPLMLSVEHALATADGWDEHCRRISEVRAKLAAIDGIELLDAGTAYSFDPTRLNISVRGLTGQRVNEILIENSVYAEMCDTVCVTLITSPADRDEWYDMLFHALNFAAVEGSRNTKAKAAARRYMPQFRPDALDVRGAVFGKVREVELDRSVGLVCAGAAGVYPPGSAILFPGEIITKEAADALAAELSAGSEPFGLYSGRVLVRADDQGNNA